MTAAQLLLDLPSSASPELVAECVQQYEAARGNFLFTMALKLAPFQEPPLLALAISHHNAEVARRAVRKCLESSSDHNVIQKLRSELLDEAQRFLDGEVMTNLPSLRHFAASMRFAFASERQVEGGHALVHLKSIASRNRAEAQDSLALRMREIQARSTQDATFLPNLLVCLQAARTPRLLAEQLGLERHPALLGLTSGWDRMYRKVIYHNDEHSLFKVPPPVLERDEGRMHPH